MAYPSNPPSKSRRGDVDGPVRGNDGNTYLAIHPIYSSTRKRRHGVLAARSAVSILAFLVLLFAVIGQVVPFARDGRPGDDTTTYSIWQVKEYAKKTGALDDVEENEKSGAAKVFAILTVVFSLVSVVLAAVYASVWSSDECTRFDEEDANEKLLSRYGTERGGSHDSDVSFPYENTRVANDCVDVVAFEEAERRRRSFDRDLGIATFSMLLAAALCALITLILMSTFYTKRLRKKDHPTYREGLALFIVALIINVVAFIVLAIPAATALYMCRAPPLRRAELMVLEGEEREEEQQVHTQAAVRHGAGRGSQPASMNKKRKTEVRQGDEYTQEQQHQQFQPQQQRLSTSSHQHHHAAPPPPAQMQPVSNPYYPPSDNALVPREQMAVAQGIPMALPGPPIESLPPHALQQQQQPEYTSGAYYEPPPQLFHVHNGKGKAV